MLVANETSISDKLFDQLGGIYLEIVSLVPFAQRNEWQQDAANVRRRLIAELRTVARGRRWIDRWFSAPLWVWPVIVLIVSLGTVFAAGDARELFYRYQYDLTWFLHIIFTSFAFGVVTTAGLWGITMVVRVLTVRRWEFALRRLRAGLEIATSQ